MSKLINGMEMIQLLQVNGKMKIKELAKELNLKMRSIRQYKEELQEVGVEIKSEAGTNGGYYLEEPVFTEKFISNLEKRKESKKERRN